MMNHKKKKKNEIKSAMDYIKKNSKVSKKTLSHSNGSSNLKQLDDDDDVSSSET